MFISTVDTKTSDEKDAENIGIIVENMHINGLEINLECVIITFNHRFSVFNFSLMSGIISTAGRNKH